MEQACWCQLHQETVISLPWEGWNAKVSRHRLQWKMKAGAGVWSKLPIFVWFLSDFLTLWWLLQFFCTEAWLVFNVCWTRAGSGCLCCPSKPLTAWFVAFKGVWCGGSGFISHSSGPEIPFPINPSFITFFKERALLIFIYLYISLKYFLFLSIYLSLSIFDLPLAKLLNSKSHGGSGILNGTLQMY